jgi:hypothetical protein
MNKKFFLDKRLDTAIKGSYGSQLTPQRAYYTFANLRNRLDVFKDSRLN